MTTQLLAPPTASPMTADEFLEFVHQAHRPLVVLDASDEVTGLEFVADLKLKVANFFATPGVAPLSA